MNIIITTIIVTTNTFGTVAIETDSPTNGLCRVSESGPTKVQRVALSKYDSVENWKECAYGDKEEKTDLKYYTTDLIAAIGSVLGQTRYDAVKTALEQTRTDGTPLWDMFVSGMYIPVNDPRIAAAKESLVGAELMTAEEFDRILATAGASDESH